MFSLPSLAPQDSYSLWYTSSTTPTPSAFSDTTHPNPHDHTTTYQPQQPSRRHLPTHRTPLSRLRHDEEYMERRKLNIQNYGSGWIKPPGVHKSLHQQREERREMEEHQEALRREQLAQELAEADAAEGVDELLQGEGMEGEMEEGRDLDDDVPDADVDATGLLSDDEDEDEEEESEEGDENDVEDVPRNVLASRLPDDLFREALIRGDEARQSGFRDEDSAGDEDEGEDGMLQEEDLVHEQTQEEQDLDMNMDGDLDDEIPEASADGYEHTDTEEELTSSEEESADEGHLPQRAAASSMVRSDGTQNSMDLSNLMSGSSQMGSSPRRLSRFPRGTGRSS